LPQRDGALMIEPTSAGVVLRAAKRDAWAELADRVGLMLSRGFAAHVLEANAGAVAVFMAKPV
jgi:hypothetical protein